MSTSRIHTVKPAALLPGSPLLEQVGFPEGIMGDCGNLCVITGEVRRAAIHPGFIVVDTEHGVLLLDEDIDIQVAV